MKVIILAGGWGTRLGQHTEWIPKPMVQIGSMPLIWHIMKYFAHYGANDFIVSAGVKAHIIKEFFLNYEKYVSDFTRDFSTNKVTILNSQGDIDWRVSVVDTGLNTLKGARIKRVGHLLKDELNIVTYGDGIPTVVALITRWQGPQADIEERLGAILPPSLLEANPKTLGRQIGPPELLIRMLLMR